MKRKPKKPVDEEMRQLLKLNAGQHEFNQKVVALVENCDKPLSCNVRKCVGKELRRLYSDLEIPERERRKKFNARQIVVAAILKHLLIEQCNMSPTDAEQDVADELNISVEALRKRFQRELGSAADAFHEGKLEIDESVFVDRITLKFAFKK
jgi:hypothetical protein